MITVESHRDAIAAALAFARAESPDPALLTILGATGTGKTILIQQIVSEVSARARRRVTVTNARELTGAMIDAVRSNTFGQLTCRFGRSDFIAIEDLGELRDKPATLDELGRLVSMWIAAGARVACTASCCMQAIMSRTWCSGVMATFAAP